MKSYLQTRVTGFHNRMGKPGPRRPVELSTEDRDVHARVCVEEYAEHVIAMVGSDRAFAMFSAAIAKVGKKRGILPGYLPEIVQESVDVQFVASGVLHRAGVDDMPHLEAVCNANDAKVGGGVDEFGKFMKPPGWKKPDIEKILITQGWVKP